MEQVGESDDLVMSRIADKLNELLNVLRRRREKLLPEPLADTHTGDSLADTESMESFVERHHGIDVTDSYPIPPETLDVNYKPPAFKPLEQTDDVELPPLDVLADADIEVPDEQPKTEQPETEQVEDELPDFPVAASSEPPDADIGTQEQPEPPPPVDTEARVAINQIIEWLTDDEDLPNDVEDEEPAEGDTDLAGRVEELERWQDEGGLDLTPKLLDDVDSLPYWGKVVTPGWASGNSVTVNPCSNADGDDVNTDTTITVYAVSPTDKAITYMEAETDDIVAYIPYGDSKGVLVNILHGGTDTSKKAMYSTFEGSDDPQADVWARDDQGANDGVTMPMATRVIYNEAAGQQTLCGFYRTLTFDSAGLLKNISTETEYLIDTPGACP